MAIIGAIEPILDALQQPALLCAGDTIEYANLAAQRILLREGLPLSLLCGEDTDAVLSPTGALSLPVRWGQLEYQLCASDCEGKTLLLLTPVERQVISMIALHQVASSLRESLTNAVLTSESLFPYLEEQEDEYIQARTAAINRSLYRMVRGLALAGDCCALELGDLPLAPEETELCAFFASVGEIAAAYCEENGITLRIQLPAKTFTGDVDPQLLERAVNNLICNSIAHTPAGGTITLRVDHVGSRALVYVTDTGDGIDADLLGVITDRASHPGPNAEGLGFGLRLVRAIAEAHGGGLMIQSGENGASVCFSIGLERSAEDRVVGSPAERYDYTGGLDHAHVEFAGVMDDEDYDSRSI